MKKIIGGFRVGAASFYVVAFSTLILVIMATSFATATIAEMTRAANDELSQSAYDSAMVGVEDAKLAFMKYRDCVQGNEGKIDLDEIALTNGTDVTCDDIIYWVKKAPDCDMVAHILGRIPKNESGEVIVKETVASNSGNNGMQQAYTCVKMETELTNVQVFLSDTRPYYIVKASLAEGVSAKDVRAVRVSWYIPDDDGSGIFDGNNFLEHGSRLVFKPLGDGGVEVPPTIAVQLLQTAAEFSFDQINGSVVDSSIGDKKLATDRATVFLVPTREKSLAQSNTDSFNGVYNEEKNLNLLDARQVANTNNAERNVPYVVYCDENAASGYICSATLKLPLPIGGARNDDTFMLVVSLPYEQPKTAFLLEFFCGETNCGSDSLDVEDDGIGNLITMDETMGVSIDSTGRANDLYRRVEVRIVDESGTESPIPPLYAIELLGSGSNLEKNLTIDREFNKD